MGYYVDIFYDRKDPKIEYKIPFASDKGINKCSTGSATLENAHDDVLHQDFYTIVSTYGIESNPQGMPLKDFLKPFGGIEHFIDGYEKLSSITIYPACEMILSEEQLKKGMEKIEKEGKSFADKLRKEFHTEEAHRIETQLKELREEVFELKNLVNLDSYVHYFYEDTVSFLDLFDRDNLCVFVDEPARVKEHADAVELEFRESMAHRLEKGYILPGQTKLLYSIKETVARLSNYKTVTISALDLKTSFIRADRKTEISAKSISSYNNSFEALLQDLRRYKKNGFRPCIKQAVSCFLIILCAFLCFNLPNKIVIDRVL